MHAVSGLWGLLAAGMFAWFPGQSLANGQWLAQMIGIATLLGFHASTHLFSELASEPHLSAAGRSRGRATRHGSPRTGHGRLSGIRVPR